MSQTVDEAIKHTAFYSDDNNYVIVKLHAKAITLAAGIVAEIGDPFSALIIDKDEVSIMMIDQAVEAFQQRLPEHEVSNIAYRLITFEVALALDLVGFMAKVSKALADANISIMTYAAYTRDHILVPSDQHQRALHTLKTLQEQIKS